MDGNGYDDIILSRQVIDINIENSPLEIFFNDGNGNFGENQPNPQPDVHTGRRGVYGGHDFDHLRQCLFAYCLGTDQGHL